ncbi:hypothetical protein JD844_025411 [Phrynosoma platyrhinos]|uniref:Prolamin-like domain-containing protein n=1 Tax=Phrynosoma platyrhinos TaxID=52577 RepID=A0ABQ7SZQ3_PHRPL|nr:hypothetical protein JD844_025411 [Phrynosoma platyrhinos]
MFAATRKSVLETFLFAVLLSTFTTLHCLCLLGPNIHVWLKVFSKNGATKLMTICQKPKVGNKCCDKIASANGTREMLFCKTLQSLHSHC